MQPEANKKHSRVNKKLKKKKITGWRVSTFIPVLSLLGGIIIPLLVSGGGGDWGGGWKDSHVIREMDCSSHCFSLLWVLKSPMITTKCGHLFRLIDKGP